MLEEEFKEASKITGKKYEEITKYYTQCKKQLDNQNIYTTIEYEEQKIEIREQALALTRDYIWFDEKEIQ